MTKNPNDRYYRIQVAFHPQDACRIMEEAWASNNSVSGFIRGIVKKELGLEMTEADNAPDTKPRQPKVDHRKKSLLRRLRSAIGW